MANRIMNNTLHFEINVTDSCNMKCKYCSELIRNRENLYISSEAVEAYLSYMKRAVTRYKEIVINFFGGEPLLNVPVIKYVTDTMAEYDNVKYNIITNGTLIKDNTVFFDKYKDRFNIQISYDGNPNHDKNRNNSSPLVKENIKLAKDKGYNINIHSVICPEDFINFYEAYKDICSLDIENSAGFVVEFAHSYRDVDRDTKDRWLSDLCHSLKLIMIDEMKLKKPKLLWFREYSNAPVALRSYCSAGMDNFSLSFDGNVYKCHGAVYTPEKINKHKICSIFDENIDNILDETTEKHKCNCHLCEECASCDTVICYNCHTSNYDNNIELYDYDYFDRWNSKNDDYICEIYRTISKYIKAYDVLRHDVR